MIKHYPSQFVSFENDRCSRTPEYPLPGERVRVDCIVTDNPARPVLEFAATGTQKFTVMSNGENGYYSFDLGAFPDPCKVAYRITCGNEQTEIYEFSVCTEKRFERFESLNFRGNSFCGVLGNGYSVNFELSDVLNISCRKGGKAGAPAVSGCCPPSVFRTPTAPTTAERSKL